jgi:hypothetical protein
MKTEEELRKELISLEAQEIAGLVPADMVEFFRGWKKAVEWCQE